MTYDAACSMQISCMALLLQGPVELIQGGFGAITNFPIFLPAASALEAWSCNRSAYNCSGCYDKDKGLKFWG